MIFGKMPHVTNLTCQLTSVSRKLLACQWKCLPALHSMKSITSKAMRDPDIKKPAPFPYKEKNYTFFRRWIDHTPSRFDENSKIIVVDGAIASGKTAFAKQLAEELDMFYMPESNMDTVFVNCYGYDMRQLDPQLPECIRSFDTKDFCLNPNHFNVALLQCMLYQLKFSDYVDALAHVFNTGQGVILDKSVYSDFVYAEALFKEGFISKSAKSVYYDIIRHTLDELLKPHLAIYLDVPVDKVLQKIKERGYPHEQNSKALTPSFLATLEDTYKRQYLKQASIHSEVLIYDWSDGGDVEVVVEDIERLDFEQYDVYDSKMEDWRFRYLLDWNNARARFTNEKEQLMGCFNVPRYDCPELLISGDDWEKFMNVYGSAPGMQYSEGYNPSMGDKGIWLKSKEARKFQYIS